MCGLLREQIAYYRARAAEYDESVRRASRPGFGNLLGEDWGPFAAVRAALRALGPMDHVLELACGTGIWTQELTRIGRAVTAVDASPEMLEINARKIADPRVVYQCVDLFSWEPERTYDLVFAGFWLSHVPPELLDEFLAKVQRATRPGSRFLAVDQCADFEDPPPDRHGICEARTVADGRTFTIVKVYYEPAALTEALDRFGLEARVQSIGTLFFFLSGVRRT